MSEFLATAEAAVRVHGEEIRAAFERREHAITNKSDTSIVTETDQAAERAMRQLISQAFPTHRINGEEFGESEGDSEYQWVLDPIDGTTNFAHGIPIFVAAAALLQHDLPIAAAIYDPIDERLFLAARGEGATENGQPLRISAQAKPGTSLVAFTRSRSAAKRSLEIYAALQSAIGTPRMLGSGLWGMAAVARGQVDAQVAVEPKLWDIVPGLLIAQEAGALALDFAGEPWQVGMSDLVLGQPNVVRSLIPHLQTMKGVM